MVGRICMDQFMVDIGPVGTAYNEDEVVLIGRQGDQVIRCEDVALAAGTIPYEILVGLNGRIPREYLGG
jgi:alanine racemase